MSKTTDELQPDLPEVEERPFDESEEDSSSALGQSDGYKDATDTTDDEVQVPAARLVVVVSFSLLAAAVMTGGIFNGFSPRIYAALFAIGGAFLAFRASKMNRTFMMSSLIAVGIFSAGLLAVIPTGFENVTGIGKLVEGAIKSGDANRPPVDFSPGWHAILGWLMACLGFGAGWVAIEMKRPALGLIIPLPVVAFSAISVAEDQKVISGIVCLILFAIGLGLLSGTEMRDKEQRPSLAFELRKAARALPLIGVICVALFFLSQTNLLFPPPLYDPSQEAQTPKRIPIGEVKDEVLFKVKSSITGPWKMGNLDVYDSEDNLWKLPPFAQNELAPVRKSGVVDTELQPGVIAEFEVANLGGAVLPGLPNTVGVIASGPKLAYDGRTGNIRLAQGAIEPGLKYTVVAAQIPRVEELTQVTQPVPDEAKSFLSIPPPPPAVQELLSEAPSTSTWERMDFMRQSLLKAVKSKGSGAPIAVPVEKVQDMLVGSREGSPFEIVAGQAMLARWAGVPSRIGYGFDGGEKNGDILEVRPKYGAGFLEVYIPTFKWLPVIGTPLQAVTSLGDEQTQFNPDVAASNEVAVKLYVPIALDPASLLFAQIRRVLAILVPAVLILLALFYSYPAAHKAFIRSRRRSVAQSHGPFARISLAYAEWRDVATDFGYRYDADTPLMFLDRVVEDEEHDQLAWLVTRILWGDLLDQVTERDAIAAEELSKSLRKRLAQGHSATLRVIAAVSRLSLRYPYAPMLGREWKKAEDEKHAA